MEQLQKILAQKKESLSLQNRVYYSNHKIRSIHSSVNCNKIRESMISCVGFLGIHFFHDLVED